jgi:hypothetical protein
MWSSCSADKSQCKVKLLIILARRFPKLSQNLRLPSVGERAIVGKGRQNLLVAQILTPSLEFLRSAAPFLTEQRERFC